MTDVDAYRRSHLCHDDHSCVMILNIEEKNEKHQRNAKLNADLRSYGANIFLAHYPSVDLAVSAVGSSCAVESPHHGSLRKERKISWQITEDFSMRVFEFSVELKCHRTTKDLSTTIAEPKLCTTSGHPHKPRLLGPFRFKPPQL